MGAFKTRIRSYLRSVVGKALPTRIILSLTNWFAIDLYRLALNRKGILNYSSLVASGESFFVTNFLGSRLLRTKSQLIFFDVGANTGKYTELLRSSFPNAQIYTFEPNPNTYQELSKNSSIINSNVHLIPLGLSSTVEDKTLVSSSNDLKSSLASLHQDVVTEFHHSSAIVKIETKFSTVDSFCASNGIGHIDFLKIDTEGHELEVLKGAADMFMKGKISVVQFEFGECHVYSRVFLRDFYQLLEGFTFYRVSFDRLIPLGKHSPSNEIFQFQNIVAVSNNLVGV